MTAYFPATRQRHLGGIADAAIRQYGLLDTTLRLVANTPNVVFRVAAHSKGGQNTEQFALRLTTTDRCSAKTVESEMTWLEAIRRDTSLIVPHPVRNESGAFLTMPVTEDFATTHIYTLSRWVDGRVVGRRPSEKLLRKVGQLMASLHHHGREFPPPGFYRPHWNCDSMTGRTGVLAEKLAPIAEKRTIRLFQNLRQVLSRGTDGTGTGCFGLIHGALHGADAYRKRSGWPPSASMTVAWDIISTISPSCSTLSNLVPTSESCGVRSCPAIVPCVRWSPSMSPN